MNWKEQLRTLERSGKWHEAISLMQKVIQEQPDSMEEYIFMNYLLMNIVVETDFNCSMRDEHIELLKYYFRKSYQKFAENPEYLYFTGLTVAMSEFLLNLTIEDYETMLNRAHQLEPENLLYKECYFYELEKKNPGSLELVAFAQEILKNDSLVVRQLHDKGALGEYVWEMKKRQAKQILWNAAGKDKEGQAWH